MLQNILLLFRCIVARHARVGEKTSDVNCAEHPIRKVWSRSIVTFVTQVCDHLSCNSRELSLPTITAGPHLTICGRLERVLQFFSLFPTLYARHGETKFCCRCDGDCHAQSLTFAAQLGQGEFGCRTITHSRKSILFGGAVIDAGSVPWKNLVSRWTLLHTIKSYVV